MIDLKKSTLIILVPRLDEEGPVKGAVALANGLANDMQIILIAVKGVVFQHELNPAIIFYSLEAESSLFAKHKKILQIIHDARQRGPVFSLSFCFSADVLNFTLRSQVPIFSSVRANLLKNYRHTYGYISGTLLAVLHHALLRFFDEVYAISEAMVQQLHGWGIRTVFIGNFVDEMHLQKFIRKENQNNGSVKLLFMGKLMSRKRPDLLIKALAELKDENIPIKLTMAGDGPLKKNIEETITHFGLQDYIELTGHVSEPYQLYQNADLFILPSESEGIPRAGMEALFFGTPCLLRDVDANRELVATPVQGALFQNDGDFLKTLRETIHRLTSISLRQNLLPENFRMQNGLEKVKAMLQRHSQRCA